MKRIECKFEPGAGQVEYPSGAMAANAEVEFFWHTPTEDNGFDGSLVKNGNFFVVTPSNANTVIKGVFKGTNKDGEPIDSTKSGSGATSFSWGFTKAFALRPDTDYTVTVSSDADCAGVEGKINAGPDH